AFQNGRKSGCLLVSYDSGKLEAYDTYDFLSPSKIYSVERAKQFQQLQICHPLWNDQSDDIDFLLIGIKEGKPFAMPNND
ncbi:hypothetical protein PFISCL1PPCAC_26768, partial [Pristionchus fissidentatus]